MDSLGKLCFMLVEREKANKLRHHYLNKYYTAEKNLKKSISYLNDARLKNPNTRKWIKLMEKSHADYRRVADLMNEQRPLLRQLRKEAKVSSMNYTGGNGLRSMVVDKKVYLLKDVQELHNAYVFEVNLLTDVKLENPYAKELYGKETKQAEANSTSINN